MGSEGDEITTIIILKKISSSGHLTPELGPRLTRLSKQWSGAPRLTMGVLKTDRLPQLLQ